MTWFDSFLRSNPHVDNWPISPHSANFCAAPRPGGLARQLGIWAIKTNNRSTRFEHERRKNMMEIGYIYIWYPPPNLCRLQFYWYLQWILYILAPILFRLNLRHQQWENWKTEKLNSIGEVWGPFFSCGIQFFSFSVLGFSWKVKTPKSWKNWKNQVTPSCVNNLEYEHLTPRSIEATDYNRIGRLRQGNNKQIIDLWALSDNLRVGAALNAVRTAEYIINQGYLKI